MTAMGFATDKTKKAEAAGLGFNSFQSASPEAKKQENLSPTSNQAPALIQKSTRPIQPTMPHTPESKPTPNQKSSQPIPNKKDH